MMCFLRMVFALKSLADEHRRQHRENECLQESHQYLDKINEYRKPDRKRGKPETGILVQGPQYKDQGDQADDEDVARHHVGEQPDHQGKRFGKYAQDLNRDQDDLYTMGNRRPENMAPVMLITAEQDHYKGDNG